MSPASFDFPGKKSPIWHPFTQAATAPLPLPIQKAQGAYLHTADGRAILDLISSWWVTAHGHAHPHIAQAIAHQAHTLEQVIFAGFTHEPAERLASRILKLAGPPFSRAFFSDNGSTAVEVAFKMAWQRRINEGKPARKILAFQDAYHGDTFGAMSLSGRSVFTGPFHPLLFEVVHFPKPNAQNLPAILDQMSKEAESGDVAAFILEPLVLGAGGMWMYPPQILETLVAFAQKLGILVIFDEVMTGFWRTGTAFAFHQISSRPDFVCLSKALTGGFLPMGLTLAREESYEAFLDSSTSRAFLHGHSFTGSPLACAAANASLDLFEQKETQTQIARIGSIQNTALARFEKCRQVNRVRVTGTILAMDVVGEGGYLAGIGSVLAGKFLDQNLLIRPLGNVVYLLPPYCVTEEELVSAHRVMEEVLEEMGKEGAQDAISKSSDL